MKEKKGEIMKEDGTEKKTSPRRGQYTMEETKAAGDTGLSSQSLMFLYLLLSLKKLQSCDGGGR